MAFILEQTWREESGGSGSAPPPLFPALSANGRDRYWMKSAGTFLTIGVHLVLLWLLATRLSGTIEPAVETSKGRGPVTFSLLEPGAAIPQAHRSRILPPPPAEASDLDVTAPDALPLPEWTVARLALPQVAPASAAVPAAQKAGAGSAGAGAGGGGVYDPFAGAAPLRSKAAASPPGRGGTVAPVLNRRLLESAQRAVRQTHPNSRGTVVLAVRVSPDGVITEAILKGGTASGGAKEALKRALVGLQLFFPNGAGPREVELPVVVL